MMHLQVAWPAGKHLAAEALQKAQSHLGRAMEISTVPIHIVLGEYFDVNI